jgi:hypothetical protein
VLLSLLLCAAPLAPFAVSSGVDALHERSPRDIRGPVFIAPRGWVELRGSRVALALEGDVSRVLDHDPRRLLIDAGARLFFPSHFDFGVALRVLSVGEFGVPGFLPGMRMMGFEARLRVNF